MREPTLFVSPNQEKMFRGADIPVEYDLSVMQVKFGVRHSKFYLHHTEVILFLSAGMEGKQESVVPTIREVFW